MNLWRSRLLRLVAAVGLLGSALIALAPMSTAGASGVPYDLGDVFAGVGYGTVHQFSPTGTLKDTLVDPTGTRENAGMAWDVSGNFYVTDFQAQKISKFDDMGNYTGVFASGFAGHPESIVFDKFGNAYVGQADATTIEKFDASGNHLSSYAVQTEDRGTDWIDLASDNCTIYYTSEGSSVLRFNVCTNTQLTPFATGLPGSYAYALRIRSNGEVMVADTQSVVRLNTSGDVIQSYAFPNEGDLFAFNLDRDGQTFWTGEYDTFDILHVDIATGSVLKSFNAGGTDMSGLAVKGELTAAFTCNGLEATVVGTPGDDTLIGSTGNDVIVGLAGDDTIEGSTGADVICGGDGNDTIVPGADFANDYVNGGTGLDLVPYGQGSASINANLATGVVTGQGTDTLINVENLNGSKFDDVIIGDGGPNQLRGQDGNDLVSGGGGNDVLFGSAGNDIVEGGDGNDNLDGGPQTDRCVQGAGSGSIVNCESTSALGLSVNDVSALEGNSVSSGHATFTVSLSSAPPAAVLVDYSTSDASAVSGSDYQSVSGTLRFPVGVSTMQVTVPFYGDSVAEPDETFTLNLSNPYGAVLSDPVGQGTILDDDSPVVPSISLSDARNREKQPNEVFTVTLSAPSTFRVTVVYQTFDGSAHAGSDYKARTGTLSIPAGTITAYIKIPLINDTIAEPTESFTLQLSSPTHATILDGVGIGTIVDND